MITRSLNDTYRQIRPWNTKRGSNTEHKFTTEMQRRLHRSTKRSRSTQGLRNLLRPLSPNLSPTNNLCSAPRLREGNRRRSLPRSCVSCTETFSHSDAYHHATTVSAFCRDFSSNQSTTCFVPPAQRSRFHSAEVSKQKARNVGS